jgi:DNA polymerase-3 subunit alpha
MQDFVHLRLHSQFSLSDGIINLKKVSHKAVAAGMKAMASTDLATMFGAVIFYENMRAAGLKPIIGCDVWVENPESQDDMHRLVLLCQNAEGYHNLCVLLTNAWIRDQYKGRGLILQKELTEEHCRGLICLSGFETGAVGRALLNQNKAQARESARHLASLFPGRFYIELQRAGRPNDEALVQASLTFAAEEELPVVATHPIQFYERSDFRAHDARICISGGWSMASNNRPREFTDDQYFKSREEMLELFADIPPAIENTVEIAKRCNLELKLGKPQLPLFPTPEGVSLDDYMAGLARTGLEKRLAILYPDEARRAEVHPKYKERLEFEIGIIHKMGFSGYFLIVQDFINWGKNNGCPVGPGRGSGAGSLVAYSLGITDLDPLEYDLLFERFLNPERVSMPDFDVDFCQDNRYRVIQYVKDTYGDDAVGQIATFGTMAAKGVLRDVGRVLDFPFNEVDELAKLVPMIPGKNPTLLEVLDSEPDFRQRIRENPSARRIFELSLELEGVVKSIGMHAGGVLIAPGKLTDFCPLYSADMLPENVISMYDKKDVEKVGLVKFDFLGLTTLTIVERCLNYIEANTGKRPDVEHVDICDEAAFKIFQTGDTVAVFQFESTGMQDLLIKAQPSQLKDLIALNALYRPGPMDLIPDYLAIKKGEKKAEYADPRIEPVLAETYGIMVYQEQVMRVAQVIGGYSLGSADILRRAMGKKDVAEMERQCQNFINGAEKNGVDKDTATHLFELMRKFAGYGFNKSHAAAYSFVAYQTAWLKAHYPAEFMASNMCEAVNDSAKVLKLIVDAQKHGITVLGPDVNASDFNFTAPDSKSIRYGFRGIKGVGRGPAEALSEERRKNGPFKDIYDLAKRVGAQKLSKKVLEVFAMAGAFDSIDPNRHMWYVNAEKAMRAAQDSDANRLQVSLFDTEDETEDLLVEARPWPLRKRLNEEKAVLGFNISGHLFDEYRTEVREKLRIPPLTQLPNTAYGETTPIAGIVEDFRVQLTKSNTRMGVLLLGDGEGTLEITLFKEALENLRPLIKKDELVVLDVSVRQIKDMDKRSIRVQSLNTIEQIRKGHGCRIEVVPAEGAAAERIGEAIASAKGRAGANELEVLLRFERKGVRCDMALPPQFHVPGSAEALEAFNASPAVKSVTVVYPQ